MAEVLLYGSIYSQSAADFIGKINEVDENEDLVVRVNTDGGNPEYGFGMIAKFIEYKGKKTVKVDGKAYSAGAFFSLYADEVEALDVSEFLIHRAAYPSWFESSDNFTAELKGNLERINGSLRKALEGKVDSRRFEEMTGNKISDIFKLESRIDVFLTAKQAKELGIVTKINKITPSKKAEIEAKMVEFGMKPQIAANKEEIENLKIEKMTLSELKMKFPELYAEAYNDGVKAEKDRVESILTYLEIDAKGVKEAIESGLQLTAKQRESFALKAMTSSKLAAIEAENAKDVATDEKPLATTEAKTKEQADIDAFNAEVDAILKINKN